MSTSGRTHGTPSCYQHHCRKRPEGACDDCKAAWAEAAGRYRANARKRRQGATAAA